MYNNLKRGEMDDISEYTTDTNHYSAGAWFRKGRISLNGGYSYTQTKGTFPITLEFPYLSAGYKIISDFAIIFSYRDYKHHQDNFRSQNYKAHLFNIGFQYNF